MNRKMKPLADRLWSRVDKRGDDECWEWQGGRVPCGYGSIGLGKAAAGNGRTHRVAWEITNGPIPEGMSVCHRCDNRLCCNPAHLFLGTNHDNVKDRDIKGRQRNQWTGPMTGALR